MDSLEDLALQVDGCILLGVWEPSGQLFALKLILQSAVVSEILPQSGLQEAYYKCLGNQEYLNVSQVQDP